VSHIIEEYVGRIATVSIMEGRMAAGMEWQGR